MHINALPDLVLRIIFTKLPLADLLTVGRVCRLWKGYQMETGEQVHCLTLLIGCEQSYRYDALSLITNSCFTLKYRDLLLTDDGTTRMYSSPQHLHSHYHLTYGSFTLKCAGQLLSIFPHITTIEIAIRRQIVMLSPVVKLLGRWSPMLKSLKMYFKFNDARHVIQHITWYTQPRPATEKLCFVNLLKVINAMPVLEHLTFDNDISIRPFFKNNSIDLPILGQLREFYYKSSPEDTSEIITKSMLHYTATNDNLSQFGLHRLFPEMAFGIVRISTKVSQHGHEPSTINSKYLNIWDYSHLTPDAFFIFASAFSNVTYLNMKYCEQFRTVIQASTRDQLIQIASVRVLTLCTTSTRDFKSDHWAYLLPNVQVIELLLSSSEHSSRSHLSKQQLQQTLSTFVQCPKLHHLFTKEKKLPLMGVKCTKWTVDFGEGSGRKLIVED